MSGWPTITHFWQPASFCQAFYAAYRERCLALGYTPLGTDIVRGTGIQGGQNHVWLNWAILQQWCLDYCTSFIPVQTYDGAFPVTGLVPGSGCATIPSYTAETFLASMPHGGFRRLEGDGATWDFGVMQRGDIFRTHIWEDLRDAFNLLQWLGMGMKLTGRGSATSVPIAPYYGWSTAWNDAVSAAQATWTAGSGPAWHSLTGGSYDSSKLGGHYWFADGGRATFRFENPTPVGVPVACDCEFYMWVTQYGDAFENFGDVAFANDGLIHIADIKDLAASAIPISKTFGSTSAPTAGQWCAQPPAVYGGGSSSGYAFYSASLILKPSFAYGP